MSSNEVLSVHLGAELKDRWTKFCSDQDVKPSTAVKQVIHKLLSNKQLPSQIRRAIQDVSDTSRRRVELRLTDSEFALIVELANQSQVSPNVWIINLIRANLTQSAQLGMAELQVLGQSNSQLLAIGRNLNQIARWMNGNQGSAPPERERIDAIYKMIVKHTEQVSQVMRANIDRCVIK